MKDQNIKLPPLFLPGAIGKYTKKEMQDYARAAIEADRKRRGEPVYLYRRKGLDDFVTCDKARYGELSDKPDHFETRVLYTAPQPAEMQDSSDRFRIVLEEWHDKTNFVQDWINSGKLPPKYLGWHRADVLHDLVENGASQPAEPCVASVSDKTACGSANEDCAPQPAEPVRVPSDEEIRALAREHIFAHAQFVGAGEVWYEGEVEFARALLARYGHPTP